MKEKTQETKVPRRTYNPSSEGLLAFFFLD